MSNYESMNKEQKEAVFQTEGPVLILAGAGSGKTRVLTHRIAYLIEEKGVNPWNIMAITFTNKAAGEMRERVDSIVGFGSESIWVSTFHSTCVRMLRRHIDRIGYDTNFTIYDTDDQKTVMRDVCKRLEIDTKTFKERTLLNAISSAKNETISPVEYELQVMGDYNKKKISQVYKEYQSVLKKNNALDFDDLLVKTVELFKSCPDVLEQYQNRFLYLMVDEYQDTNTVQFEFIRLLAARNRNLCVVGDDDQSIYKFRGANIRNILDFENLYPEAHVIKLEQNYRSTQNVLNAANAVISNNKGRKAKALWTEKKGGNPIHFMQFDDAYEEADFIATSVAKKKKNGLADYKDCAVLYRTNAQSRMLEERFVLDGIPYNVVGGVNFYSRKEIKDMLAYLKTIDNGKDDIAVKRIINVPKRGIGATTMDRVQDFAIEHGISFYEALQQANEITSIGKSYVKLQPFVTLIQTFRSKVEYVGLSNLLKDIIETTGYVKELEESEEEDAEDRIGNIDELISKLVSYEDGKADTGEEPNLSEFLEEIALVADIDRVNGDSNVVLLMTLHSAKGLEFPHVYLAGMEDGLFPSYMTITSDDPSEIEEERRLAYVGITRAKDDLTLTCAKKRMTRGETQYNPVSRFVKEIPIQLMDNKPPVSKQNVDIYEEDSYERVNFKAKPFGGLSTGNAGSSYGNNGSYGGSGSFGNSGSSNRSGSSYGNGRQNEIDFELTSPKGQITKPKAVLKKQVTAQGQKPFIASGISGISSPGIVKGGYVALGQLDYKEGDRVRHIKYGDGLVEKIEKSARDYQVSVLFDGVGTKVMYAAFAKLIKI